MTATDVDDLTITPLSPHVGAEISGVDLARVGEAEMAIIRDAFDRRGGLLFRDQSLDPSELVAFSRHFGTLDHAPVMENGRTAVEGYPEIYIVSNILDRDGKPLGSLGSGEAVWHTDMSYLPNPPVASILYALEVPPAGGDTWLTGMAAAYERLPAALRERIAGRSIKHDGTYNSGGFPRAGVRQDDNPETSVGEIHPMVCLHPGSGRRVLYLGRRRNAYIPGLSLGESEALLDEIWEAAVDPEICYRHSWRVGDVLMWDNRATMHRRDPFDPTSRRLMQRTQISGGPPPVAAPR